MLQHHPRCLRQQQFDGQLHTHKAFWSVFVCLFVCLRKIQTVNSEEKHESFLLEGEKKILNLILISCHGEFDLFIDIHIDEDGALDDLFVLQAVISGSQAP